MLRSYGDSKVFGESYGEGPVRVVWLHGWARRGEDFVLAASALADRGVASVTLDLPGFGASPPPDVAGGARHYAALIAPVLAEIADEPIVLVGHSLGGRVAVVLASTSPELVHTLVLTGVPLLSLASSSRSPWGYRALRRLYALGLIGDARMEASRQRYGSTDYRRAQGVVRDVLVAMVNESYEEELTSLVTPTAFLWGANDTVVAPEVARRASALVKSTTTMRFVEDVGHLLPLEAPNELASVVEEALGS